MDDTPDETGLLTAWERTFGPQPQGWDFSFLAGRVSESAPPWDFEYLCRDALRDTRSALDLGTGGGERLLALLADLPTAVRPTDLAATEGWPPNLPVATEALAPHGIETQAHDADADQTLPFPDGRFELIMNRHESYRAEDVLRTLTPGGTFLTQQVGGDDFAEIHDALGHPYPYPEHTLERHRADLVAAGFEVSRAEQWYGPSVFDSVTTLLEYFSQVPWDLPDDFTVAEHRDTLLDLHRHGTDGAGNLTFTNSRFVLVARKSPVSPSGSPARPELSRTPHRPAGPSPTAGRMT
ncbi:MAG: class I SAM-dependent methyltransferase [Propionibacteriaceae bacterium]